MGEGVTERRLAPWPVRALRIVAWSWFVAGLVAASVIWLNARETVTTTRTITAHARLTFQDIETHVSILRVSLGFVSILVGLTVWAILLVVGSGAEGPSGSDASRDPSTPR
jgi:hypothetical protein